MHGQLVPWGGGVVIQAVLSYPLASFVCRGCPCGKQGFAEREGRCEASVECGPLSTPALPCGFSRVSNMVDVGRWVLSGSGSAACVVASFCRGGFSSQRAIPSHLWGWGWGSSAFVGK